MNYRDERDKAIKWQRSLAIPTRSTSDPDGMRA